MILWKQSLRFHRGDHAVLVFLCLACLLNISCPLGPSVLPQMTGLLSFSLLHGVPVYEHMCHIIHPSKILFLFLFLFFFLSFFLNLERFNSVNTVGSVALFMSQSTLTSPKMSRYCLCLFWGGQWVELSTVGVSVYAVEIPEVFWGKSLRVAFAFERPPPGSVYPMVKDLVTPWFLIPSSAIFH